VQPLLLFVGRRYRRSQRDLPHSPPCSLSPRPRSRLGGDDEAALTDLAYARQRGLLGLSLDCHPALTTAPNVPLLAHHVRPIVSCSSSASMNDMSFVSRVARRWAGP